MGPLSRQHFVHRFPPMRTPLARTLLCALLILPAFAAGKAESAAVKSPGLDALLKKVENRYNHAQTLKLDFSETFAGPRSPVQSDSGVLYLRKPGRMRWEYTNPPGKLFISNGKEVFLYTPEDHRVEESTLKESEAQDMRAPIAFLLGKLNFTKEFKSFETRVRNGETWIVALPKSENLAWSKVEFLATPDGEIHKVNVITQTQATLDFTFSNERLNVPVAPALFTFRPPPGVSVVEAGQ